MASRKQRRRFLLILAFGILAASGAKAQTPAQDFANQAQSDYQTITNYVNGIFSKSMGFYTTLGWNTPPGVFDFVVGPHVEVGLGVGADLISIPGLGSLNLGAVDAGSNFSIPSFLPAPFPVVTGRVGLMNGLDLGLKLNYLPAVSIPELGFSANYVGWGLDLRYKILDGKLTLPAVTVGLSWDTMRGGFSVVTNVNQSSQYKDPITTLNYTANLTGTNTYNLNWDTKSFGAKVEVGKDLGVIYPFAAVGFQRNSGNISSSMKAPYSVTLTPGGGSSSGTLSANSDSLPVIFEPKFVAGFDLGQGLHWAVVGESNGTDIAGSTSFRAQF